MIEVKNLTKSYGATIAVNNVSFSAQAGEIVGFIGPNGAGKSTTMRVITCYLPADDGTVTVDGYDVFEESIEARKRIGYLPESNPLYTDMGVVDYLKFIAQVRGVSGHTRNERIKDVIDICSLEPMMHKIIGELSKGYRQRVGLAQALIHDPPVLILDEPTAGLDPYQIIEIRNLIKEIGRQKTIIFSTHILSQVAATCDRTLIISNGKIVANASPQELALGGMDQQIMQIGIIGPHEEIETKLEHLDFVLDFKRVDSEAECFRYHVTSHKDHRTATELAQFVNQNNWELTELYKTTIDLEDVFLKLTRSESQTRGELENE